VITHKTGTHEEWLAARDELLVKEKELTRRGDQLAAERRALPWVPVEKEYRFETAGGSKTLPELFDGRSQLMLYHFMFGPPYAAGCPICSSMADSFNGVVAHLNARDVTLTCVSRAPLDKLLAYQARMGWTFPWVSSYDSDYKFDLDTSHTEETAREWVAGGAPPLLAKAAADCGVEPAVYLTETPKITVYATDGAAVYLTYSTTGRGLEAMMQYYPLLDRVPGGRDEPDGAMWLRRHDEYDRG
jgi:predicted dithiol-disulfide oxidoreductase (DUF899 family)